MQPSLQEQAAFYDRWNAAHRGGALDEIEPEIRARGLRVVKLLRERATHWPHILEVGCGTGWLAGLLAELGSLTALDLSPRAIEIARSRGIPGEFIAADFLGHDFGPARFDAALCIETLFYVADQEAFVQKLGGLMRPGGVLGLTAINKFVYERSSDVREAEAGQLRNWLSRGELLELLQPEFRVERVQTMAPRGDRGILRLINSYKLNAIGNRLLGEPRLTDLKERMGFGAGIVILATRR